MKYIIHRGITSKKNSDNSYMAIKKAIFDKESIGVEFDIRLTKDNKIVLSHFIKDFSNNKKTFLFHQ